MSSYALMITMSHILGADVPRQEIARRREAMIHTLKAFGYKRVNEVSNAAEGDFVRLFKEKYLETDPVLKALSAYEIM